MNPRTISLYSTIKPSSRAAELPILLGFNLVLVLCSYISITLPFSPVPITGQTFGVLLVAMALGRIRAVGVVAAYLIEGALGLPVFAGGSAGAATFLGPTGGYLLGFLAAAAIVGHLADKGWDRGYLLSALAMVIGTVIIFGCGLLWLSRFVDDGTLLAMGLIPFLPGAVIKLTLASLVLPTIWKSIRKVD